MLFLYLYDALVVALWATPCIIFTALMAIEYVETTQKI